ncbi:MAG: M14 family metallopeptidase, partial [Calditrichaeota bacterium]|nr:M14 family metallopeptidase [Calditrichota bacterium]
MKYKPRRPVIFLFCFFSLFTILFADDWKTFYERSDFKATPNYEQTIDFCKRLADYSPWVSYAVFGKSAQGRDLPLLIVNKNSVFDPQELKNGDKLILLIQAGIHSGEIDGKDAGLALIRDLVVKKQNTQLLDNLVILF